MLHNIFDAHAHYDDKWFDEDRSALLSSMPENGVSYIVNAAVDIATAKTAVGYAEQYPHMYACAGIHPENLEGLADDYLDQLAKLLEHPRVVALGEIGLDYHWDIPRDIQNRVFEEQLRLARELDVPVVIHDREAHGDVMELVRRYKPRGSDALLLGLDRDAQGGHAPRDEHILRRYGDLQERPCACGGS